MKKIFYTIATAAILATGLSSCVTYSSSTMNREAVQFQGLRMERKDYTLTSDLTAEAEVTITKFLIWTWVKTDGQKDKGRDIKIGILGGMPSAKEEAVAAYKLLDANPNVDYLTNVRYMKTFTKKGFKSTYKVKVMAKGVKIKADK